MKSEIAITIKGPTGSGKAMAAKLISNALKDRFKDIAIFDEMADELVIKAELKPISEWNK